MKNIYFIFLLALSFRASAQIVTADPAVGAMSIIDNTTGADRSFSVTNLPVTLKVPVFNLSPYNAIPNGSTTLIIGLGSRLALDPSFNLATARLSNYFSFTYNTSASQPRIIGTQIAAIPRDFIDSTMFRVYGTNTGNSAASVNFSLNPGGNVDDEDGNNNSSSITYQVIGTTLPVKLADFTVARKGCNLDVAFTSEEEINVSRYEIEASRNGSSFTKLGELAAKKADKYAASYPITEALKATSLLVRIKSVDKDGQVLYSAVRSVAGTCEGSSVFVLNVFPNPVKFDNAVTVNLPEGSFNGKYSVSLLDAAGRILEVKEMQLNSVTNFRFDIRTVTPGQYLLKVAKSSTAESATIRFQKQ